MKRLQYLLSGSLAYDTVLLHKGRFEQRILPHALSRLNVSFGVDSVADHFGGTGGNIAYNAMLVNQGTALGTEPVTPVMMGVLGAIDGARYLEYLQAQGLCTDSLVVQPDACCSHAWVLTDQNNNQITGFSSGACDLVCALPPEPPAVWHLAPTSAALMSRLAAQAQALGASYLFDPGQTLPALLAGEGAAYLDLSKVLEGAQGIFVNDYEAELLCCHTGRPLESWLTKPDQFIVQTLGAQGVRLIRPEGVTLFSASRPAKVEDPTGCGDALRAGFLHAYLNGWPLEECLRLGSALASLAVECSGGQSHTADAHTLTQRMAGCQQLDVLGAPQPHGEPA
jgi:adenosine kinase